MPADFSEVVLDEGPDDVDLVAEVSVSTANTCGTSAWPGGPGCPAGAVRALAVGAHLRVARRHPANPIRQDLTDDPRTAGRDDAALVARAGGLARLAGRPPLDARRPDPVAGGLTQFPPQTSVRAYPERVLEKQW